MVKEGSTVEAEDSSTDNKLTFDGDVKFHEYRWNHKVLVVEGQIRPTPINNTAMVEEGRDMLLAPEIGEAKRKPCKSAAMYGQPPATSTRG